MTLGFDELWKRLNELDETVEFEAKTASQIGPAVLETVSAFSNEPNRGGGYLLLGVGMAKHTLFPAYEISGVSNPDKLQADLATQCRDSFNRPVRPLITVESVGSRRVIVVFVPEAQPSEKPIFLQSRGLPKGAFRRIGSTDQVCTEDDIAFFYQSQSHHTFDETIVKQSDLQDIDPGALKEYRRTRRDANPSAAELRYDDEELLFALRCVSRDDSTTRPTIAGLALFGKHSALRRYFPMMRVDYIRVPGREWVPKPDERFESIDMLGPLMDVIPRAINAVLDDIPKAFYLPPNSNQRTDLPLVPRDAIREAIVNAVMHRSYRQRQPVQIIRYSNRLEIRNPGHSLVPDDRLGEPGSMLRNEKIAAVLHETRYAETKGTGIRAMRESLAQAGLSPPTFESDREKDSFVVTFLFHHFLSPEDIEWLGNFSQFNLTEDEHRALVFAREVGAINNAAYRDINRVDTLVASGHLRKLRDHGLVEQKGKAAGTYYVPTERLLRPVALLVTGKPTELTPAVAGEKQGLASAPMAQAHQLTSAPTAQPTELPRNLQSLPTELAGAVAGLGTRCSPEEMRAVIRRLCAWQPLSSERLAEILGRNQHYLLTTHIRPMVRDGALIYLFPENPVHPQQAYRASPTTESEA